MSKTGGIYASTSPIITVESPIRRITGHNVIELNRCAEPSGGSNVRGWAIPFGRLSVFDLESRGVLGPCLAFVIEPSDRDVGVTQPFLDFGDVRAVIECVGRRRRAQRVRSHQLHEDAKPPGVVHHHVGIDWGRRELAVRNIRA